MFSPDSAHERIMREKPILAFDESRDFAAWQAEIKAKISELLGDKPEKVELNPQIETTEHDTFFEHRIVFDTEKDVKAVAILAIPKNIEGKVPLCIVLQGHGTGMHVAMGRKLWPSDDPNSCDRDIALQALERGYAALCIEQRGMGERRTEKVWPDKKDDGGAPRCNLTALCAMLVGRTLIGERCWDVSRGIDLALTFDEIDPDRIMCTGNSGGGTATYYAACMDERIKVAMPSCSVCTYRDSIGAMPHCTCNFVPNIAKYMDMGDMAGAIAPRRLIIVNGREDDIFPHEAVEETFETVKRIYTAAGCPENCAMTTGEGGHRYFKDRAWGTFDCMDIGW